MRLVVRRRILRQQDRHHRAEQVRHGGLMLDQRAPERRCREALLDNERRAGEQRLEKRVQRIRMEQRQRRQQGLAFLQAEQLAAVDAPPEILRMRAAHAFRQSGRAGGVEDRQRLAGPHRGFLDRCAGPRERCRAAGVAACHGVADTPDLLHRKLARPECLHRGQQVTLGDQQARARVDQDVPQLRTARRGVDRHRDRADPRAAEKGLHELGAVRAKQRDAVSGADAGVEQGGAVTGSDLQRIAIAPARCAGDEQRPIAEARGLTLEQCRHDAVLRGERGGQRGEQVHKWPIR